ncbi:MAG: hypothetical protein EZS28_011595 [Streblomastix strix]|uniref:Uncharacterized protein n=1 Tax=Streblomastix strix TaxID=222440 RepID=A0A5J4WDV5_9EUKA|nr:MAG: hypothetical protein EZS28_011595 [Streblomastix strix]
MCVRQLQIIDTNLYKKIHGTEGQDWTEKYKTRKVDGQMDRWTASLANSAQISAIMRFAKFGHFSIHICFGHWDEGEQKNGVVMGQGSSGEILPSRIYSSNGSIH